MAKEVTAAKAMEKKDTETIASTGQLKSSKLSDEKIDSTINSNINNKLNEYKKDLDSFSQAIYFVDSILKKSKLFRKNKESVARQLTLIRNYNLSSYKRLRRFEMIEEGLTIAEQKLFYLAAFFGPGKYIIPDEKMYDAEQAFSPVLDSLSNFYNKYSDLDRFATIRIIGFADGTGFNTESETYKTLTAMLNDDLAGKEKVNKKLSELRAKNIADLLDIILAKKITNYETLQKFDFLFLETGKGEDFPSNKVTDYTVNDERRRVVLLYWSILPK